MIVSRAVRAALAGRVHDEDCGAATSADDDRCARQPDARAAMATYREPASPVAALAVSMSGSAAAISSAVAGLSCGSRAIAFRMARSS